MNGKPINVLLVEDNPGDVRLIREMLAEAGGASFELQATGRLSTGLERLAAGGIDTVLLDLSLPDSRGLDTYVRTQARAPQVPTVVLTGLDDEALALEAVREGAQDYLLKGQVDGNLLVRALRYAIERKAAEQELRKAHDELELRVEERTAELEASSIQLRKEIAERKRAEADTQRRLRETTLLSTVTAAMASAADTAEALHNVCAELAHFLKVPQAGFAMLNPQRTAAEVIADFHPPNSPAATGTVLPVADNPSMAYILEQKTSLAIADAQTDPLLRPVQDVMRERNVRSILIVPVMARGEVIGTLGFDAFEQREFGDADIELVQNVALQAGQVLVRRQAEDALRESEERFRDVALSTSDWVWEVDAQGRYTYCSEQVEEVLGYPAEEILGKTPFDLMAAGEAARVRTIFERIAKNWEPIVDLVNWNVSRDGREICLLTNGVPLFDTEGRYCGYRGVDKDITERVWAEKALRQSEKRYRGLFEGVPIGIYRSTPAGKVLDANAALVEMLGYPDRETLLATNAAEFYADAKDRNRWRDQLERDGVVRGFVARFRRNDGIEIWGRDSARIVRDDEDRVLYYEGTLEDITQQVQAEEALRQSEERFRELADLLPQTIFEFDLEGNYTYSNRLGFETFGYTQEDIHQGLNALQTIVPGDRERAQQNIQQALSGGQAGGHEYTALRKDGSTFPAIIYSSPIMREGRPVGLRGIVLDITERVRAERALRDSEARYRMLVDNAPLGIYSVDTSGQIKTVNQALLDILGSPSAEATMAINVLEFPPLVEAGVSALLERCLESGETAVSELPYRSKWGKDTYVRLHLNPIRDAEGKVVGAQALAEDVADRVRAQEQLQQAHNLLETRVKERTEELEQINDKLREEIAKRKRSERDLRRSRKRFRELADLLPLPVFEIDLGGDVTYSNRAGSEFTGYGRREAMSALRLVVPEHRESVKQQLARVLAGGRVLGHQYTALRKDGSTFDALIYASPIVRAGKPAGGRVVALDVSERVRAERKLERYAAELEQLNEEARQLAYIISHDLRPPLVNVRGYARELESTLQVIGSAVQEVLPHLDEELQPAVIAALQEEVPEAIGFISSSVTRMSGFVEAVLQLARLGRRELAFEPIDMNGLVQATLDSLAHQIEESQVKVTVGPLPEVVADRTAMEQIIGNLLNNAVIYLEPGRPGEIEVSGERGPSSGLGLGPHQTLVRVRDNGRGIPEEHMDKVFAPFRRAGQEDVPGEGMGLAYAQALVRRHGGRIWCESELGVGTTFCFTIDHSVTERPDDG